MTSVDAPTRSAPPRPYWAFLGGVGVTRLTTQVLAFGLTWAATAYGALWASGVLVAVTVPRVVLTLVGGSVADRFGPWRVMVCSDAAMVGVMGSTAVVALATGSPAWLLVAAALAMGIADAFVVPSSMSVPKLLVPEAALGRAMAANQLTMQVAGVAGPVLGGLVMTWAGVPLAMAAGTAGFVAMLLVLLALRRHIPPAAQRASSRSVVAGLREGWRHLTGDPLLRTVLSLTVAFATLVLPIAPFLVPLLAREHGWEAGVAGIATGCYAVGAAAVALTVLARGPAARAGLAAAVGVAASALGAGMLAAAAAQPIAFVGAAVAGAGTGLFGAHVGPLFVAVVPRELIGRLSALMILAQSAPMLVAVPVIGLGAEQASAAAVTWWWAAGGVMVAAWALTRPELCRARLAR